MMRSTAQASDVEVEHARIRYYVSGDGPPVLFIQGVGLGANGWQPQVDALASRFRCVTFDNRGIGDSLQTGKKLSIPQMAADAIAVLDALRISRAHVAGHSLGGVIACELALQAPDRVRSLALLCTFARGPQATAMTPALLWSGVRSRLGSRAMRRAAFLELVMPPSALRGANRQTLARELEPIFGHDLADQPAIATAQLLALRQYDRHADLASLRNIPALVVSAEHDRIARPRFGRELAGAIPGAQYVEIAGAGHGVPIHRAREVNDLLTAFWTAGGR
jgi:pimeloyl-ACP methyl ester carboxylesterase